MRGFLRGMEFGGDKVWKIRLLETDVFWQGMVKGRIHPELDSRAEIRRRIALIKQKHEKEFNRRFIYFICTRDRVRFATELQPRFSFFRSKLFVHVRVEGRPDPIECMIPSKYLRRVGPRGRVVLPSVTCSDVAITLTYPGHWRETTSVHDFLITYNINLGIDTHVRYVGLTRNPDTRPLLDKHEGRGRVERRAERENRDVFFFYNTFMVGYHADDENAIYQVSNVFTDEVDIQAEGLTLEKIFVAYLRPDCQGSLKSELGQLRSRLKTLADRHRVRAIDVEYEVDCPSEYYRFYSDAVQPSSDLGHSVPMPAPVLR